MTNAGPLALLGGAEWQQGCEFDGRLLEHAGTDHVVVLPTAAAYEHPSRAVEAAQAWFSTLGAHVGGLDVLQRRDAENPDNANIVREARFVYFADGSPLHLRSVLKDSLIWDALVEAWRSGAVVAGSSAAAMVFGDPMVDPRGGAFTLGLGLIKKLSVVPHWERWTGDKARRMTQLMPRDVVVAEIEEKTALIRWPDGEWEATGKGSVVLTLDGSAIEVEGIEKAVTISSP